jgi:hypothetical protein
VVRERSAKPLCVGSIPTRASKLFLAVACLVWVGSGLLVAERQFRKVQGYREIPALLTALANAVSKKAVAEEVKVA